jgi:hypothetical protein
MRVGEGRKEGNAWVGWFEEVSVGESLHFNKVFRIVSIAHMLQSLTDD